MRSMQQWLMGRKTYLLSGVLAIATLALLMAGRLNAHTALVLLLIAAFGFPATFRAALDRHHDETLTLLEELAETGAAVAIHNLPAAVASGEAAAKLASVIAAECRAEGYSQ